VAVLPGDSGRRRTCNHPIKSRELCRVELRSRDVAGRNRTCAAPLFRRALYRAELRPRVEPNIGVTVSVHHLRGTASGLEEQQLDADAGFAGVGRIGSPLGRDTRRSRHASAQAEGTSSGEWARLGSNQQPLVCKTSALPLSYSPAIPGQGVEPRPPGSEPGVLPVRRSRSVCFHFQLSMPLAYPSTLDRLLMRTSCVLRGGALEPEPRAHSWKIAG
jgi:hypothetical protein